MTETIDQLIRARFDALASSVADSDWSDVLRRAEVPSANRRPLSRRKWVAVALVATAAIVFLVAPALGIGPQVLDFFAAKQAPKHVSLQFEQLNVGAPRGMSPGAIAGQTRLVKTYRLRSGRAFPLWVAPTRRGTFCFTFGGGGGCSGRHVPTNHEPGDVNSGAIGLTVEGAFRSTVLAGYVYDKRIAELTVRFKSGPPASVPLLWVSPPIDAGFFFYPLTDAQRQQHSVVAVVALDAHGKEIARIESFFRPRPPWFDSHKVADLAKKHVILRSGQAKIAIAPSRTGGNCFWLYEGHSLISTGCAPQRFQTRPMGGGFSHGAGFTVFSAQLKPAVARVGLDFQDGARVNLLPLDGFVLYTIPEHHWPRGHRLTAASAYSSTGTVLARETFDPRQTGLYSCTKPAPIGAGLKTCP